MDQYAVETFEEAGLTAKLIPDTDVSDPRKEWGHLGHMACWHRRAHLGDQQIDTTDYANMEELIASFGARIVIPLYLYEHSGMTMSAGSMPASWPDQEWDAGQVGFIYLTAEDIRKEWTCKRITKQIEAKAREVLFAEVAEYDQWLTGDVYGYVVEDEEGNDLDSCWGFFGREYAEQEAKEMLAYHVKERREMETDGTVAGDLPAEVPA